MGASLRLCESYFFFSFRPPRRTRRKGVSKAVLCGLPEEGRLSAKNPFATVAKNPPNPLIKSLSRRIAGGSCIPGIPSH